MTRNLDPHSDVQIYCDGSYKRGRGAWAFVVIRGGAVAWEQSGMVRKTNSLRMELQAAIHALASIPPGIVATLYSDSRILVDALSLGKMPTCPDSPNQDLYDRLITLNGQRTIAWKWVRAHAGNPYNERCDQLCALARAN